MKRLFILIVCALIFSCSHEQNKNENINDNSVSTVLKFDPVESELIINQIEQTCFDLSNGYYASEQSYSPSFPFYNVKHVEISTIFSLTQMGQMIGLFLGKENYEIKFEPSNIKITVLEEKSAKVSFKLHSQFGKEKQNKQLSIDLKKIGGIWRIDGKTFFKDFK